MTTVHPGYNNKSVGQKKKSFPGLGAGIIFLVVAFLGAINPAQADQQQNYKRFQEIQYGFSFEIPGQWTIKLTPKKDYLIEGPKGSDAFEIALIIQIIQKSQNPGSSAQLQLEASQRQIMSVPGAKILRQDRISSANQQAPYFAASYKTKTSQGNLSLFGHLQVVLDYGDYYYWVSYSGPAPIYEKYRSVMEHLLQTFSFQ